MKANYWSRLRVLTWSVLFAVGGFASCSDDNEQGEPTPPPVELNNQIELDGATPVDIRSAIYELDDNDNYVFYLSPTSGITGMEEMEEANDYLRVTVDAPKGLFDPTADAFEFSYGGITVSNRTMSTVESLELEVGYKEASARLKLVIELKTADERSLRVNYDGTCNEATLPVLENEYELDGTPTAIGSAVVWKNPSEGTTTYGFYAENGVTEPSEDAQGLTIVLGEVSTAEIDLSTADPTQVSVRCGDFTNGEGTTGTLHIGTDANGKLTLTLDAECDGHRLRAAYTGDFAEGYESNNFLRVTMDDKVTEVPLTKIFATSGTSSVLMYGTADVESPELLSKGDYAVALTLTANQLKGGTFGTGDFRIRLFDYINYKTYDNSKVQNLTGSLTITRMEDDKTLFLQLEVTFPDGPKIESEWIGTTTAADKEPDLTPVAPFRPCLTITAPDGTTNLIDKDLISVEMRMEKDYKLRGGDPQYGGATFDAYYFYFRGAGNESTSIDDVYNIPQLMLCASAVPTEGELDLASGDEELHWELKYTVEKATLSKSSYSENYSMFGKTYYYCPDDVKVTVVKNDDKTWKITFRMVDYGPNSYNTAKEGTQNTMLIEWEGLLTKYSGSKTNDLTDADY